MSVWLSLSEIDALSRKAARGAGYSWGMAEEAGRLTRWLAAHGLPGPQVLAQWLVHLECAESLCQPSLNAEQKWQSKTLICPITAGTIVSDREDQILSGAVMQLSGVSHAWLMLAPVARIAEAHQCCVAVQCGETEIFCKPNSLVCAQALEITSQAIDVQCALHTTAVPECENIYQPSAQSRQICDATLTTLQSLAGRTYAPATEASRLSGAGSGLNDND